LSSGAWYVFVKTIQFKSGHMWLSWFCDVCEECCTYQKQHLSPWYINCILHNLLFFLTKMPLRLLFYTQKCD